MFPSAFMNMFGFLVPAPFLQGYSLLRQSMSIAPFPRCHPLPPNPYSQDLSPEAHAAYNQCLQNQVEAGIDATLLAKARCLGFLIIEAPDDAARDYISHEIMECQGDGDRVNALAQLYISHLIRSFHKFEGRGCKDGLGVSRPSFEEEHLSLAVDPPDDHTTAKKAALERDNFCCMVSGDVETDHYLNLSDNDQIARYPDAIPSRTHFSHIFSPSTSQGFQPEPSDPKTRRSIILNYGHIDVLDELDGSDCDRLSNGLTLASLVHEEFERLCLWFEAIPNTPLHTYRVCALLPHCRAVKSLQHPRTVTFTTTTNHPLPDPRYLKLHAVVCRVGHLSGVTEYLDHEEEEKNFLAHDS